VSRKKKDRRPYWTGDSETDPFKSWKSVKQQRIPHAFIWGLYTGAGFHEFDSVENLIDCIKDQDVIVGFHNGGKFDAHVPDVNSNARLLDYINQGEDMKIINGRLVAAKIGRCEIRDTWNLFPAPLKTFGYKKEIEYWKLERSVRHLHMKEIREYLFQDCKGLYDPIQAFENQYGRHLTQAGAAMAQWKKISGQEAPKTDQQYFQRFRPFYFGGRVQCLEKGYVKGPLHVRDIRSAYPFAMLSEHPYDPTYITIDAPRKIEPQDMVTLDCVSVGALPFRDLRGTITFPRDDMRRRYQVTGWEVIAAEETGALREVEYIQVHRFAGLRDFGVYINHFYEARKKYRDAGDEAQTYFAKILMNSLYGKFGANPDNYGNFMCVPWEERDAYRDEGFNFDGKLGLHAVVRRDLDPWQKHFINIATAASITGFVRAYLWRSLDASDNPVYCDTDCIVARAFDAGMPIGKELGEWAHEGTASDGWFAGKKLYYLKGDFGKDAAGKAKREKMASKGVRPDAKKIKAAAMGQAVKVRSDAPTFTLAGKRPVYFQERTIRTTAEPVTGPGRLRPAQQKRQA
jgi:hypothetical protein